MEFIKNLVLTVHGFFSLGAESKIPGFSLVEEQRHGLLTARVASHFFDDDQESQYAFTAGLLHDIGKLVLSVSAPGRFAAVVETCKRTGRSENEVEIEMLGVTHAKVGAYLLGLWGLPYPIVEAVAFHHEPFAVPERKFGLISSTWLANALVNQQSGNIAALDHSHLEKMDIAARLPEWTAFAHEEVRKNKSITV
jgi:putative nucleotidyltransferase with HDIG domain